MKKMTEAKKSLLLALAGEDCTGLAIRYPAGWRPVAKQTAQQEYLPGLWATGTVKSLAADKFVAPSAGVRQVEGRPKATRITDEGRRVAAELRPARNERPAALDQEPA